MSDKDEALRLAEDITPSAEDVPGLKDLLDAAAMLRSQHARISDLEEGARVLFTRIQDLEEGARVALSALESGYWQKKAIASLRKTLGET